ncbi:tetratricopeptide repeat protein [Mucilaginibacter antarcticus]|uniref:tetratricopeptide repeat protein n=1 Tax=Mucilaginibacter antarcticus TaxID=1855725 RepID=UPI0036264343
MESLLRYADFLVNAGDYTTLQEVATKLSKSASVNARIYRYLGYAAYENKDYPAAQTALDSWFSKATPERILPRDYTYLGRIQLASGKDTTKAVANLEKAAELDSTSADEIYSDIATMYRAKFKWAEAAAAYEKMFQKSEGKLLLNERFYYGVSAYQAFKGQSRAAKTNKEIKPDSTWLTKADSALSFVEQKAASPIYQATQYRAYIADEKDTDYSNFKGIAKPHYERVVTLLTAKATPTAAEKRGIAEAYGYLGNYSQYRDKDIPKAEEWYTKSLEFNPEAYFAKFYFDSKASSTKPAVKKAGSK